MGKNRSIGQQLIHTIADCSSIGESKRSYKGQNNGDTGYKIFSIKYKEDLQTTARDLGCFIKAEHPEIRRVRDLTPDALQEYLQGKADAGCAATYIGKLISHINKLQLCCSHTYGKSEWHTERLKIPALQSVAYEKIRDKVATNDEYVLLLDKMRRPGCGEAWKALVLARTIGLRVSEAANIRVGRLSLSGGRWGCGTVKIQGKEDKAKGGRYREVHILNPEDRQKLQELTKGLKPGDYIIQSKIEPGKPVQADSLDRALQRAVRKVPEIEWKANNGLHAFRKLFAQECYDAARCTGCSKKEANDYAHQQLGHGHDRTDLANVYVENQW